MALDDEPVVSRIDGCRRTERGGRRADGRVAAVKVGNAARSASASSSDATRRRDGGLVGPVASEALYIAEP